MSGLPEAKNRVTAQRAETKEALGELESVGLLLLCGQNAAFLGGTKQLPQAAVGVLCWVRLFQRTAPPKPERRALSWLLSPRKPQMSTSHSGLRQLSPRAWHSLNQGLSGALWQWCWCLAGDTLRKSSLYVQTTHAHTLWSLQSGGD